jgi:hypothetical protein
MRSQSWRKATPSSTITGLPETARRKRAIRTDSKPVNAEFILEEFPNCLTARGGGSWTSQENLSRSKPR